MLHPQRVVTCSVHLWHSTFCKYYMLSHFSSFSTLDISSMRHYALSYYIDVMLLNEVEHCCLILHGIVTHSNALYGNAWYCNIFHGPLLHWYYRNDTKWLESHWFWSMHCWNKCQVSWKENKELIVLKKQLGTLSSRSYYNRQRVQLTCFHQNRATVSFLCQQMWWQLKGINCSDVYRSLFVWLFVHCFILFCHI